MQYTLRNVPKELDRALKARAKLLGKSVNQVTLEALAQGMQQTLRRRNLRTMPGSWSKSEAEAFEEALASQRSIDQELWK
jgi:plasmid stability protein